MSVVPVRPVSEENWKPWFPSELAERLGQAPGAWYVVGGWALDLWHGSQTRDHEDLEFAVLSENVEQFRKALHGLDFFTAHEGVLDYLPATTSPPPHVSQLWGLDSGSACWRVDMMIEQGSPSIWIYKRDPSICIPRADIIRRSETGIPYLAPPAVLLFKAKHCRAKDEADFERALPKLDAADKAMLRGWLDLVHPGHAWHQAL